MKIKTFIFTALLIVNGFLISSAQFNVTSSVINFRTTADRAQTTKHYGRIDIENNHFDRVNAGLHVTNTSTSTSVDPWAIRGVAQNRPDFGIGVEGLGGYVGVWGRATYPGSGDRYGVWGIAQDGTGGNFGVYAYAPVGLTNHAVYASGDIHYTGGCSKISDESVKKNIAPLSNALNSIMKLSPKKYDFKNDEFPFLNLPKKKQMGLVAQEVEKILPEVVSNIAAPEIDSEGKPVRGKTHQLKGIDYTEIIPLLIAAVQEQQNKIEELEKKLATK